VRQRQVLPGGCPGLVWIFIVENHDRNDTRQTADVLLGFAARPRRNPLRIVAEEIPVAFLQKLSGPLFARRSS
jgi:hypothetical protein